MERSLQDVFGQLNLLFNKKITDILSGHFNGTFHLISTSGRNLYPFGIAGKFNYRLYQLIDELGAFTNANVFQLLNQSYATLCQQLYQNIFFTISPSDQALFKAAIMPAPTTSTGTASRFAPQPMLLVDYLKHHEQSDTKQPSLKTIANLMTPVSNAIFHQHELAKILRPKDEKSQNLAARQLPNTPQAGLTYTQYLNNFSDVKNDILDLLQKQQKANEYLNTLKLAIVNPTIGKGGMTTTDNAIVPAYTGDFPLTTENSKGLLTKIESTSSTITIGFDYSWDDRTDTYQLTWKGSDVFFRGETRSQTPILELEVGSGDNSQSLILKNKSKLKISFSIRYPGVFMLALAPDQHWFDASVFKQVAVNQATNKTGYQFLTSQFTVDQVFGPKGNLRGMTQLVISSLPTISVEFENISYNDFKKQYPNNSGMRIRIGNLSLADSLTSYLPPVINQSNKVQVSSGFEMHFNPKPFPSDLPLTDYPTFLLGATLSQIPFS